MAREADTEPVGGSVGSARAALADAIARGEAVAPLDAMRSLAVDLGCSPRGKAPDGRVYFAPESAPWRAKFAAASVDFLWQREINRQVALRSADPEFARALGGMNASERERYTARRVEAAFLAGERELDRIPDPDTYGARAASARNRVVYEGERVNPRFGKTYTQFTNDGVDTIFGVLVAVCEAAGWEGGGEAARAWGEGLKGWFGRMDRAEWRAGGPWNPETGEHAGTEQIFAGIERRARLGGELERRGYSVDGETIDEAERRGVAAFPERPPEERWDHRRQDEARLARKAQFNQVWGAVDHGSALGKILYPVADAARYGAEERHERERRMGVAGSRDFEREAHREAQTGATAAPSVAGERAVRRELKEVAIAWVRTASRAAARSPEERSRIVDAGRRLEAWVASLDATSLARARAVVGAGAAGARSEGAAKSDGGGVGSPAFVRLYLYAADPARLAEGCPPLERPASPGAEPAALRPPAPARSSSVGFGF